MPISCPSLNLVLDYEFAIREKQSKLMNQGHDFQKALETAINDPDLRLQRFMGPFTCSVNLAECRALSAPGIRHVFPQLQKGTKRPAAPTHAPPATHIADSPSKGQVKRAKAQAKKKAAETERAKQESTKAAKAAKGAAKGAGKGKVIIGKGAPAAGGGGNRVPPGCREKDEQGRQICYAFNKGNCTRGDSCKFQHVSWNMPAGAGQG